MSEEEVIEEVKSEEPENSEDEVEEVKLHDDEIIPETQEEAIENPSESNVTELVEEKEEEPVREVHPDVAEPTNMEAIVEGLLYIVGEDGVKIDAIAQAIGKSKEDTKVILDNIQNKYAQEIYGIELVGYGSNYKFVSKKSVYPYAQELFHNAKASTLSQAALETLAIIAYKQPITRVEIEELRGVGADMMLRKLEARGLIREAGRSDAPGKPILYEVTEEFMDSFKLYTLNELPDLPEYKNDDGETNLFD